MPENMIGTGLGLLNLQESGNYEKTGNDPNSLTAEAERELSA